MVAASAESVVVLVDVNGGIPPAWGANLEVHLKNTLDDHPRYRWVPPPQVSLAEAQMVLGCDGWAPPCMGQVANMMGAAYAYVVTLTAIEPDPVMVLQIVDKKGRLVRPRERLVLPGIGGEVLDEVRGWVTAYLNDRPRTMLQIETDVPGAEVLLDGKRVGRTPFILRGEVERGLHALELRVEGRAPLQQPLEVRAGEIARVEVSLGATGFSGHEPKVGTALARPSSLSADPALAPWLFGAGGVSAATAAGMAVGWLALLSAAPCPESSLHEQDVRLCETQAEAYARGAPSMGNDLGSPEFGRTFKETLLVTLSWGAIASAVTSAALLTVGALAASSTSSEDSLHNPIVLSAPSTVAGGSAAPQ
jgi:hypothetical protein